MAVLEFNLLAKSLLKYYFVVLILLSMRANDEQCFLSFVIFAFILELLGKID